MCTSKKVCKAKWVLCLPQGLSNFGDWSCIFAFGRAQNATYHSQRTVQTLSGVVEGVWDLVRTHPMDSDRSCQVAQAQLQDHTNQCCQPVTNQLLQINPFLLILHPDNSLSSEAPRAGMYSLDTLPNAYLEEATVLPIWQKPIPITKDKQQDQSLTLFSSSVDIMACSTSVCHEGCSLFSLLCWTQGLLTPAEDAESRLRE